MRLPSPLKILVLTLLFGAVISAFISADTAYAGRYKLGGAGECYWDENDTGPDQCQPGTGGGGGGTTPPAGRYKLGGAGECYWDPNDSGPDQCQPTTGGGGTTPPAGMQCSPPFWNGIRVDACTDMGSRGDCTSAGQKQAADWWCANACSGSTASSYQTATENKGTVYAVSGRACPDCGLNFTSVTCATPAPTPTPAPAPTSTPPSGGDMQCAPPRWNGIRVDACFDGGAGGADCSPTGQQQAANWWCANACGASTASSYLTASENQGTKYASSGRECPGCGFNFTDITCGSTAPTVGKQCEPPQWDGIRLDSCWDTGVGADCSPEGQQKAADWWCQNSCGIQDGIATSFANAWDNQGTKYAPTGLDCPSCGLNLTTITCAARPQCDPTRWINGIQDACWKSAVQEILDMISGLQRQFAFLPAPSPPSPPVAPPPTSSPTPPAPIFSATPTPVSSSTYFAFARDLTIGSTGEDVCQLQQILIDASYLALDEPTCSFDALAQRALARWQTAHSISPAAGFFGPATRTAMNSLLAGDISSSGPGPAATSTVLATRNLGTGLFPDVAWHNGRIWIAYEPSRGPNSRIHLYSGALNLSDLRLERNFALGADAGSFPRLISYNNILWLAYRDGAPLYDTKIWRSDTGRTESLGASAGNDPQALGNNCVAWQKKDANYTIQLRALPKGPIVDAGNGAPTGLSRILPAGLVRLIDEDRNLVPWGTRAWIANSLTTVEGPSGGVIGRFNNNQQSQFTVFAGQESFTPHAASDGKDLYAIATWGAPGVRLAVVRGPMSPPPDPETPVIPCEEESAPTGNIIELFTLNLTIGSTGDEVIRLQQILIDGGYLTEVDKPTGYFGAATQAALAQWQTDHNITPATGYFGSATRAVMNQFITAALLPGPGGSGGVPTGGGGGGGGTGRVITSIFPTVVQVGETITIAGTNLSATVQVHNEQRERFTTTGTVNQTNTEVRWTVNPSLAPGNYTLRVGPSLTDYSDEVPFSIFVPVPEPPVSTEPPILY